MLGAFRDQPALNVGDSAQDMDDHSPAADVVSILSSRLISLMFLDFQVFDCFEKRSKRVVQPVQSSDGEAITGAGVKR